MRNFPPIRLSPLQQLEIDSRNLPGLGCYEEMYELVNKARRRDMGVILAEVHNDAEVDKWIVWDVFTLKGDVYYWLVTLDGDEVFSYCTSATTTKWPACFGHRLVHLEDKWFTNIALPHLITPHVRKKEDLHFTNSKGHSGWERGNIRWGSLQRKDHPELVDALPLGVLYRAIDVGAIIPVFKTSKGLLGLQIKRR